MFYSDQLLGKDGPLACAWLAANLEKKLTKQQLLNVSVEDSARAVEDSSKALDETQSSQQPEPMALRISGQLLYGIVRIYSRKAKYLYEDANDILMKLKAAFATSTSVILPVESTVMPSVRNVTMADTVTEADLLYRKSLNFDDLFSTQRSSLPRMSQIAEDVTDTFPDSIEVGRNGEEDELDDVDVDFDLGGDVGGDVADDVADESVEVGRAEDEANASAFEEIELPAFELDENSFEEEQGPATPPDMAPIREKRARPQRTYQKTDVVRTARRRIRYSATTELSADTLREQQEEYMVEPTQDDEEQARAPGADGDDFISRYAKRRRTEPSAIPDIPDAQPMDFDDIDIAPQSPMQAEVPQVEAEIGGDEFAAGVNGLEEQNAKVHDGEVAEDDDDDDDADVDEVSEKATSQIAGCIQKLSVASFDEVVAEDQKSSEPLSSDPRKEASRTFFELLVLGGNSAVKLSQDRLFGEIEVTAAPAIANFV